MTITGKAIGGKILSCMHMQINYICAYCNCAALLSEYPFNVMIRFVAVFL